MSKKAFASFEDCVFLRKTGNNYALSVPEALRKQLGWEDRQLLILTIDVETSTLTVKKGKVVVV